MSWPATGWGISYCHHVRAKASIKKAIGHMAHRLLLSHNIWLFINHAKDAKVLVNGSTGIK
jgi:kynurenine formamidase